MSKDFKELMDNLNKAQKEAVETIDGPVMVIAGPGTGKTQVLAIRIANILVKTDVGADAILCLTFTNAGVQAMRERLRGYIGKSASHVEVTTFHSFAGKMVDEFYLSLGYKSAPSVIDDRQSVAICDEILENNDWEHLRTRANKSLYFGDIKSLISLLKRERLSPEDFQKEIEKEINFLKSDESSLSSRGPTKGQLKAEVKNKIDSLERTKEIVRFYELYEEYKKEKLFLDYDDVLEELVRLVETSEDAKDAIRERYLYVHVDEHQDSSGVQNQFLKLVWADVEAPNIFVVGDDRQLIYGFGGASLSYFEGFKKYFEGVKVITLTENYRSTQKILDTAEHLLKSSLAEAPLLAKKEKGEHPLRIIEADYPRDEIIRAGLEIKEMLESGSSPKDFAILVPKNTQVKNAIRILRDLGIPVSSGEALSLFDTSEFDSFMKIFKAILYPNQSECVAPLLLDPYSGIPTLEAHKFLLKSDSRKMTLASILEDKSKPSLFEEDKIASFFGTLKELLEYSSTGDLYGLIQRIGEDVFLNKSESHEVLTRNVEVIRSFLHLVSSKLENNPKATLKEFVEFVERLLEYGTHIPLASFGKNDGVSVMTLHSSKGLEYDAVWIAHMDEKNLGGRRSGGFTIPESVKERLAEEDEEVTKRQIYVAITRAKRFCTISYGRTGYTGGVQNLSPIISDLPSELFDNENALQTESYIKEKDLGFFVTANKDGEPEFDLSKLSDLVKDEYSKHKLSVTHLNNFFSCPWKWYFRNFLQLPEPTGPALQFGNLIHGAIENILKVEGVLSKDAVLDFIEEGLLRVRGASDADLVRYKKEATSILNRWVKNRLPMISGFRESEKALSFRDPDLNDLLITGKIDLKETLEKGVLRVTDFKTGSVKTANDIKKMTEDGRMSDYLRQLAMYSYLLENSAKGDVEVGESSLEFVEAKDGDKNAIFTTRIGRQEIDMLKKDIKDFDQALSSGEWLNLPCNFKAWKTGEECEYCKLAKMYV